MAVTKLSRKEWAYVIEKGLRETQTRQNRLQYLSRQERVWLFLNEHRLVPIALGIIACALVLNVWGWKELLYMLLSWVIGIVVVTTLVASILHPSHPNGPRRRA